MNNDSNKNMYKLKLWDNVERCGTARQATGDSIIRRRKDAISMPIN